MVTVRGNRRLALAFRMLTTVADSGANGMTCEEVIQSVSVPYPSGSRVFFDLASVGCLKTTGSKRVTESGSRAHIYNVAPGASFVPYLVLKRTPRSRSGTGLSPIERAALAASLKFINGWHLTRSQMQRTEVTAQLIKSLVGLTRNIKVGPTHRV